MIWYVFSCRFGLVWFRMKFDTKLRSYLKIKESTLSRSDEEMANSHHTYISYFIYFHILKWISFHLILATAKFSNHKNELFDFCYCVIFDKIFSVEVDIKFVDSNEPIKFVYDKCVRVCMEKKRFFYSSTLHSSVQYCIAKLYDSETVSYKNHSWNWNDVADAKLSQAEWDLQSGMKTAEFAKDRAKIHEHHQPVYARQKCGRTEHSFFFVCGFILVSLCVYLYL